MEIRCALHDAAHKRLCVLVARADTYRVRSIAEALFLVSVVAMLPLNAFAWWRFRRTRTDPTWRRRIALLGLVANTVCVVYPVIAFVDGFVTLNYGRALGISPEHHAGFPSFIVAGISSLAIIGYGALLLASISVICGAFAPTRVRIPLVVGGVLASCFWLILPSGMGVL